MLGLLALIFTPHLLGLDLEKWLPTASFLGLNFIANKSSLSVDLRLDHSVNYVGTYILCHAYSHLRPPGLLPRACFWIPSTRFPSEGSRCGIPNSEHSFGSIWLSFISEMEPSVNWNALHLLTGLLGKFVLRYVFLQWSPLWLFWNTGFHCMA